MTHNTWQRFAMRCGAVMCGAAAIFTLAARSASAADEEGEFEIHEISLWAFDPTLEQANQFQHYASVMPGVVDTERSRVGAEGKVAPFSLMTFRGQPAKNVEIDLRVQPGRFVGHWPPGESKSGRLRWLDVNLSAAPDPQSRVAAVDAKHWFNAARGLDALYLQLGGRTERFIVFDAEFKLDQPLQISGGPERYQVANLTKSTLYDVFVVAPETAGRRIGRLASLPAKAISAQQPTESKPEEKKPAEAKPEDKKPGEAKPVEAKAAEAQQAAAKLAAVAAVKAEAAEADVVKADGATPAAPGQPPAAGAPAAPKPIAGDPVDVEMSAPLADAAAELASARQALAESLKQQGLSDAEVELFMDKAAPAIFGAKETIVVCRLPAEAIEERLPLATYPAARKTVRTALVLLRNVDPKLKDDVNCLVTNLGAADYAEREAAEKRLSELGRLAVPALKAALKSPDVEVQFRAERLLLSQNEKVDGT